MTIESEGRQADWRRKHPKRYLAHVEVGKALNRGDLVKGACEVCGRTDAETRIDGHHDDYSKPLDVRWLCRRHHILLHSRGDDMFAERRSA
ncbi:hypothetical protein GTW25_05840 [Aliihoeflea aestuarii]|jgi:hypothetical protein|uniref:hypothetical protein n=1 Tax=Aliihoeflea aestuarii TaxID=453840 RepID=UPI0020934B08|nr:hypothetical protein [Aliihoeflea aestuarii]MCO6390547.1 hypothetical protein [Aliihoeflea aestuarii]